MLTALHISPDSVHPRKRQRCSKKLLHRIQYLARCVYTLRFACSPSDAAYKTTCVGADAPANHRFCVRRSAKYKNYSKTDAAHFQLPSALLQTGVTHMKASTENPSRKPRQTKGHSAAFDSKLLPAHAMIVSRSASHIASTLSAPQRINALAEALAEVAKDHGDNAIEGFLIELKSWFIKRDYGAAVELVSYLQEQGCLPDIPQTTPSRRDASKDNSVLPRRAA